MVEASGGWEVHTELNTSIYQYKSKAWNGEMLKRINYGTFLDIRIQGKDIDSISKNFFKSF